MNRIKELRKKNNLTQNELAETIGISKRTLIHWEKGERDIKSEKAQELADFFNVPVGYLLGQGTVFDVLELATKVITGIISLNDIPDEKTRKIVTNHIETQQRIIKNDPPLFIGDYSSVMDLKYQQDELDQNMQLVFEIFKSLNNENKELLFLNILGVINETETIKIKKLSELINELQYQENMNRQYFLETLQQKTKD